MREPVVREVRDQRDQKAAQKRERARETAQRERDRSGAKRAQVREIARIAEPPRAASGVAVARVAQLAQHEAEPSQACEKQEDPDRPGCELPKTRCRHVAHATPKWSTSLRFFASML